MRYLFSFTKGIKTVPKHGIIKICIFCCNNSLFKILWEDSGFIKTIINRVSSVHPVRRHTTQHSRIKTISYNKSIKYSSVQFPTRLYPGLPEPTVYLISSYRIARTLCVAQLNCVIHNSTDGLQTKYCTWHRLVSLPCMGTHLMSAPVCHVCEIPEQGLLLISQGSWFFRWR